VISADKIKKLASEIFPKILEVRRHMHVHPELSFEEHRTMQFICEVLDREKIEYKKGIAGTGIVAHIEGKNPNSRMMALRADLDALPIREENKIPYSSKNEGVMHACGHDVHTACVIGAAIILNKCKNDFEGTVRLIFQPGEEKLPGGASLMIKEGVLRNPVPDFILGQHVFPELEVGKVGFRSGMYMASTDELYLTVKGKGGHAAMPKQYVNPLLIASEILIELHEVFMGQNKIEKEIPTVLAFGKINSTGGATNVIPDEVRIEGTFRTMNEAWRENAHTEMKKGVKEMAEKMGGEAELRIEKGYPFLVNDEKITEQSRTAAQEYLGKENVVELDLRMTAEDFAYYTQIIPSCFYRLGTRNESKGIISPVHTATFDVDEKALEIGAGLMAWLVVSSKH
jgi:amidohydrolase